MYCGNCGNKLSKGSTFCDVCGSPVQNDDMPVDTIPSAKTQISYMAPVMSPQQHQNHDRRYIWIPIMIVGVLIIIAFAVMLSLRVFSDKSDSSSSDKIPLQIVSTKSEEENTSDDTDASDVSASTGSDASSSGDLDSDADIDPSVPEVSMADVSDVTASSYCIWEWDGTTYYYPPEQLIDGDPTTSWQEGVEGFGVGESVTIMLDDTYTVSGCNILNGFQETEDLYYENGRPTELLVLFSDGTSTTIKLEDSYGKKQSFTFDEPVETNSVTFQILDVIEGTRYYETAISEIELF